MKLARPGYRVYLYFFIFLVILGEVLLLLSSYFPNLVFLGWFFVLLSFLFLLLSVWLYLSKKERKKISFPRPHMNLRTFAVIALILIITGIILNAMFRLSGMGLLDIANGFVFWGFFIAALGIAVHFVKSMGLIK